jgi:transcriptional regulator with XRE-family HTH domain
MFKNETERQRMGERIATLRKSIDWTDDRGIHRHGMTQTELATLTGLQRSHIVRLEQGRYGATIDVLSVIAEALNCEIDFIQKPKEIEL